eukprot:6195238-Pleurochrysis_carterae.AAC.1
MSYPGGTAGSAIGLRSASRPDRQEELVKIASGFQAYRPKRISSCSFGKRPPAAPNTRRAPPSSHGHAP